MTCKVQILAPIFIGDEIKTSGTAYLPDELADDHEKYGRVEILERDGVEAQWPGCCVPTQHDHDHDEA